MSENIFGFVRHIESKKHTTRKREVSFLARRFLAVQASITQSSKLSASFFSFLFFYFKKKILSSSLFFEKQKNRLVRFFMMKRGRYNRPFLHIAAMTVVGIGILVAPFLADTYPFIQGKDTLAIGEALALQQSINVDSDVFKTEISQKPREKTIIYRVQRGDTISTIAQKFGISTDTIKWANALTSDNLSVDDELKILPVTGIEHKVGKGDTIYSIAKRYDTNPQAIVDFPFNEFANPQTFSLVEGQMLIVPDGIKPAERPIVRQRYIATGPVQISPSGFTWPLQGIITQGFAWYHPGLDIAAPTGTPVVATEDGTVTEVYNGGWNSGYGTHVVIRGASGVVGLYAHLSGTNVAVGYAVSAGRTVIGWVGSTGRSTGPHLHLELRGQSGNMNPMSFLGR